LFNPTSPTHIYTLSLHDALPISSEPGMTRMNNKIQERFNALLSHKAVEAGAPPALTEALARQLLDRLGQLRLFAHAYPLLTNLRSEEHTSELQSRGHLVCRLLLE